jgi:predicted glycoside hydrolase/deacetylase ChbG (UPF0249 family)
VTAGPRYLIVTADDFGMSPGVNEGVIRAHESGVVTAASLMVRGDSTADAAEYGKRSRRLSIGLHFDFGEWFWREGNWIPTRLSADPDDAAAVQREAERQLEEFLDWMSRPPSHLNSHQHFHRREPYRETLIGLSIRHGVPLREHGPIAFLGGFYGQTQEGAPLHEGISVDSFLRLASGIGPGATEIACHPSAMPENGSIYSQERVVELETLCDPRLRSGLETVSIKLTGF